MAGLILSPNIPISNLVPVLNNLDDAGLYKRVGAIADGLKSLGVDVIKVTKSAISVIQGQIGTDGRTIRIITTMDKIVYESLLKNKDKLLEIGEVLGSEPIIARELVAGKKKAEIFGPTKLPVHAEQIGLVDAEGLGMKKGTVATSVDGCETCEGFIKKYYSQFKHVNLKSKRAKRQAAKPPRVKPTKAKPAKPTKAKPTKVPKPSKAPKPKPSKPKKVTKPKPTRPRSPKPPKGIKPSASIIPTDRRGIKDKGTAGKAVADSGIGKKLSRATPGTLQQGAQSGVIPKAKRFLARPGVRFIGGVILQIGVELVISWLKSYLVGLMLEEIEDKITTRKDMLLELPETEKEFEKFRNTEGINEGYELYYLIELKVVNRYLTTRYDTDISRIELVDVSISRVKGKDTFPSSDSDYYERKAIYEPGAHFDRYFEKYAKAFYHEPIFQNGLRIKQGTEDAADEKFQKISSFRQSGISTLDYLISFREYVSMFPKSVAAKKWHELINQFYFEILLVETGIFRYQDLMFMAEYPFPVIMNNLNFLPGFDLNFIESYKQHVDKLKDPELRSRLTNQGKKYFDRLRKGRMCDYDCHTPVTTAVPAKFPQFKAAPVKVVPPAVPAKFPQFKAAPVKVVPPVFHKMPAFVDKGDKMLTDSYHKPGDRGVTDPLTGIIKKTSSE